MTLLTSTTLLRLHLKAAGEVWKCWRGSADPVFCFDPEFPTQWKVAYGEQCRLGYCVLDCSSEAVVPVFPACRYIFCLVKVTMEMVLRSRRYKEASLVVLWFCSTELCLCCRRMALCNADRWLVEELRSVSFPTVRQHHCLFEITGFLG